MKPKTEVQQNSMLDEPRIARMLRIIRGVVWSFFCAANGKKIRIRKIRVIRGFMIKFQISTLEFEMKPLLLALTFTVIGGLAQPSSSAPVAPAAPEPLAEGAKPAVASPPTDVTVDAPPSPAQSADEATNPATEPSLTVQVETLQTGSGTVDPKSVTLLAPFPAKALAAIPLGWRLDASASAPPFIRKVELAPGTHITLKIRPHLLVPAATAFALSEPGFDPALGYSQAQTVSAILANSIEQLDADAKHLGTAIDLLQQLVSSLPHPAPQPPATPTPPSKR